MLQMFPAEIHGHVKKTATKSYVTMQPTVRNKYVAVTIIKSPDSEMIRSSINRLTNWFHCQLIFVIVKLFWLLKDI